MSTTFGLLHGAFEGSWCWTRLIPELRRRGDDAVTVDLPIDDVTATWDDHADVALAAFDDPEIVIVAHSRSGRLVPRLLERGGYSQVLLLSASIPGGTLPGPYATGPTPTAAAGSAAPVRDDHGRTICTPAMAAVLFSDCSQADIDWALANVRPQHELPVPTDTRWPQVTVNYIYGADEPVTDPTWIRAACSSRLGIDPVAIPGGHSLFVSRPRELSERMSTLTVQAKNLR